MKLSERVLLQSLKEKNVRGGSAQKAFRRSNSSRKGKGLVEGPAKKVAEGSNANSK